MNQAFPHFLNVVFRSYPVYSKKRTRIFLTENRCAHEAPPPGAPEFSGEMIGWVLNWFSVGLPIGVRLGSQWVLGGYSSGHPTPAIWESESFCSLVLVVKAVVTTFGLVGKRLRKSNPGAHLGCEVPLER